MADNTNYIGVAMGMDVTDLKAGLSEANKQIQKANAEFKSATAGMDDWTKSSEGLEAKISQLGTVLDLQKKKLAGLNAEYDEVVKAQGENSEAAKRLYVQIKNQEAVVKKTEKEYKNYNETLDGVNKGNIDLEKVTLKAGKAVEKAGKQAKDSGDGFTIAGGAIATFIGNGLTKLVGACANAIKSIAGLADSTREYRKTLATLDAAAGDVGVSTDYIRDKFTDLMGVLQDDAGVTEGLNNLLTAGFDEKSLDSITASLEGAALKWKDTLKFEGLADSLQEWIGSGGESLTGNFAELLERMGYNLEEVKEKTAGMTDEQRRNYAVNLLNKEGLSKVSEEYRAQNADMINAEKANVEYQNTVAEMGKKIEPVMTKVREGFTKLLDKIIELISDGDMEAFAEKVAVAFDEFITDVLPNIISGLQWLIDNKKIVAGAILAMGAAFAVFKVAQLIDAVRDSLTLLTVAQKIATAAQWLWNAALTANPIGIIIMAIAALIGIIIALVKNWDKVKEAGAAAWEWIKNAWSKASEWFSNIGKSIGEAFSKAWQKLKQGASDAWQGVKNIFSKVASFFGDIFSRAWKKVKDIFSTGGKIFDGIKDGIATAFKNIVNRLIRGINKVVAIPFNAINKTLSKIRDVNILGAEPFKNLISEISVPEIPELEYGGVLRKGQVGLLEGKGNEAVLPLERHTGALRKIADLLAENLGFDINGIKSGLSAGLVTAEAGNASGGGTSHTVVNAGMTVNYNGKLSRKEIRRLENDNYNAVYTRLKKGGAIK